MMTKIMVIDYDEDNDDNDSNDELDNKELLSNKKFVREYTITSGNI